jgi:transcriptional regulator with XRE-family HTH domain
MSTNKIDDFIQWLDAEENARGWTDYRLAKEAKLSFSILSRARNSGVLPKWDACVAIAEAFKISPITVFRAAGLLPPAPKDEEDEARLDDWIHLLKDIDPEDERELRQIAEVKIKRRSNEKLSKSLKSKKAT